MKERGLTEKQRSFARFYAEGFSQREAYRKAYGCKDSKVSTCDVNASRVLRNAKVIEYLEELREKAESAAVLNRRKRMIYLSRVVTTAPDDVDGESDLCQELVTGEFGIRCRMPDKLRAIQELNRMDGAYAPEKVKVESELSFGALLKGLKSTPLVQPQEGGKGQVREGRGDGSVSSVFSGV